MAEGKTILVTGGSGGIGRALTKRLLADGYEVIATARDPQAVDAGIPVALDLTDERSIAAAAARVREHTNRLAGLVNNAGIIIQGPLELVPMAELRRQFETNVLGQMALTQTLLPLLRTARGRIVNVGAPSGRIGIPLLGPIGASKAALHVLNDALRMELRDQGIAVSLVIPGALQTEIFAKASAAAQAAGPSSAEAQRLYAPVVEAAAKRMAEMKVRPVDATVQAIHHALTARRPKARYTVGSDARQLELLRKLPTSLRDRALMSAVGLSRTPSAA